MNKNLPFTKKSKMADLILQDYHLIPIIGRFGIDYGFGNKTVKDVCDEIELNVWFFLEIINSFHNHDYFPKKELQNFDAKLIIDYLSNTHRYYTEQKIPDIQGIINDMETKVSKQNYPNIKLLNGFFKEYKNELKKHLDDEEKNVFPYVLELEKSLHLNIVDDALYKKVKHEPIEKFEDTHENMEVKLSDLKNLIIRHLPPVLCKELCQKLLMELFRLETDLDNHSRIEDKVLVPKVRLLEEKFMMLGGKQ